LKKENLNNDWSRAKNWSRGFSPVDWSRAFTPVILHEPEGSTPGKIMKRIIIIVLLLLLIANFSLRIDIEKKPCPLTGELMYFPSGIALRALSIGFYAPLADLVWLRFIQYYGRHRLTDYKFTYLYHIFDVMTNLDPFFLHAYTLGAFLFTHDAKNPEQAKVLLKKGMRANPDEWRLPFIYAFIHYVFLEKYDVSQTYFLLSSRKPNAPDMPKRWAAYTAYMKKSDLKTSLALWLDIYNNTDNPEEKAIAELYIKDIKTKLGIEF
jgi:hypothetical protein